MEEQWQPIQIFLDMLANLPRNDESRRLFRDSLQQRFEERLPDAVERIWDLPPIIVHPIGRYLELLTEARNLYVDGYFYSCVAMCGIVGERLMKDALRTAVRIQKGTTIAQPSDKAFEQFERVDASTILRFLKEADILSLEAAKAANSLVELRNQYAHARGKASQEDALKGIKLLHVLVEDTVSVFKNFTIKEGRLMRKAGDENQADQST